MLQGKKIILGVSGSIAAYKAAHLLRLLVKQGAEVKVIMTAAAQDFISALTLATLSKNDVIAEVSSESAWNNHVELGLWADAYIVAPATANTVAKFANGLCSDMLSAVYLSARCQVVMAPSMDLDMWTHPATQRNIATLKSDGCLIIDPEHGELASGLVGTGRLAEPEHIVAFLTQLFRLPTAEKPDGLAGKKVLITAGPTFEPLDPVRFIGNHSTGKMGIALADEAARRGAAVTLLLGPTHLRPTHEGVKVQHTATGQLMYAAAMALWPDSDVGIMAAAVADYRPAVVEKEKIKKQGDSEMNLVLVRNPDIAAALGALKEPHQRLIGFALETNNENEHARRKLQTKQLDFIVLNSLQQPGAGFGHDTNEVTLISAKEEIHLPLQAKTDVAIAILNRIAAIL